ncbi:hypothetical protein RF11_08957 [Thelohanellus kitauei]|uniref:Uncharacterized protein n=1 Tax=Thelohanellus kitauei TaxID=669202 RepID=A0A0C2MMC1_THEKT|nr:hypothetical protein RF11_08957 [Thelohanellus kitauei]
MAYFYCHLVSELLVSISATLLILSVFFADPFTFDQFASILLYTLFCGLYFGLLTRDTAFLLTEKVHVRLGISGHTIPVSRASMNICALCGLVIVDYQEERDEIYSSCAPGIDLSHFTHNENIIELKCGHRYSYNLQVSRFLHQRLDFDWKKGYLSIL